MNLHFVGRGPLLKNGHIVSTLHLFDFRRLLLRRGGHRRRLLLGLLLYGYRAKRRAILNLKAPQPLLKLLKVLLIFLHYRAGVHFVTVFPLIKHRFALFQIESDFLLLSILRFEIAAIPFASGIVGVLKSILDVIIFYQKRRPGLLDVLLIIAASSFILFLQLLHQIPSRVWILDQRQTQ